MSKPERVGKQQAASAKGKPQTQAVAPIKSSNKLPIAAEDAAFAAHASAGLENVTARDVLIPRLTILQQLSPQLNSRKPEYIKDAKQGQICDVGTGEVWEDEVLFLPLHYRKDFLEWAPRSTGKGLIAIHNDASILDKTIRNDKNKQVLPNGNIVEETAQFFGVNMSAGNRLCFVPMSSTQLKKARRWINVAQSEKLRRDDGTEFVAPLFYRVYKLGVAEESNNEGSWFGWRIERGPALPELPDWQSILTSVTALRAAVVRGEAKVDVSHLGAEDGGSASGERDM